MQEGVALFHVWVNLGNQRPERGRMIEVYSMGQLVSHHRFQHPGRHVAQRGMQANAAGGTAIAAPARPLRCREANGGNLNFLREACRHAPRQCQRIFLIVDCARRHTPKQPPCQFGDNPVEFTLWHA